MADQEGIMMGRVEILVPRLLKKRGLSPMDLSYGARITPATAYKLADEEQCKGMGGITFEVLAGVCEFLGVDISDVLSLR
jgi:DNA-binding Xre family transcriptional regulator